MNWLRRTLIDGPYMCLCLNEKDYRKAMNHLKIPKDSRNAFVNEGADATVHFFKGVGEHDCAVVCLNPGKYSVVQIYSLLVHEAVHIWQHAKEAMNEERPGIEIEAYAIQALSERLMNAYNEQKRRK